MSNVKKDCFAYKDTFGKPACEALKEMQCLKEECKFYKSVKEINYTQIESEIKNYSLRMKVN